MSSQNKKGFSVILAIVITAFLTIVSAGVLDLILREMRISSAFWHNTMAYAGAEGSLEKGLLEARNQQYGYTKTSSGSENIYLISGKTKDTFSRRDVTTEYEVVAQGINFSGTLAPTKFEIIPLFTQGETTKHPVFIASIDASGNEDTATASGVTWNIIGNQGGKTRGIAGIGSFTWTSTGTERSGKDESGKWKTTVFGVQIDRFLTEVHSPFLVIYNATGKDIRYQLSSDTDFSLPYRTIYGSSLVGEFRETLKFEDHSTQALFDALKYSLFSAQ